MPTNQLLALSRREQQIMDVLIRLGRASVSEMMDQLPEPPGYSAVRTMLGRLEDKGYVEHDQDGPRYRYRPSIDREAARESALERMVRTFFQDSPGKTVAALLDRSAQRLTDDELDDLAQLIDRMRQERR